MLLTIFATKMYVTVAFQPSSEPTGQPSGQPTDQPTSHPSSRPSREPTGQPTSQPTSRPTTQPSSKPTTPTGQPTGMPSSAPTYKAEAWGQVTYDKRRHRQGGLCENSCSHHGTCEKNVNCNCFTGLSGEPEWTGPDCSQRTCPKDFAWVGEVVNNNDLHPWMECSNQGICDRKTGNCGCFPGYDGVACQRSVCPADCNGRGTCLPEKHLASKAGRIYNQPWDSMKQVGCYCDKGYRGPACDLQECPSGPDPLGKWLQLFEMYS